MMLAKMVASALLRIKMFLNKDFDVIIPAHDISVHKFYDSESKA